MEKQRLFTLLIILTLMSTIVTAGLVKPASGQSSTIMKVETSNTAPKVGEAFTVTVTLTNVQNLYGVEVTLKWNPTVLPATNIDTRLGVESYMDGVLHESSTFR